VEDVINERAQTETTEDKGGDCGQKEGLKEERGPPPPEQQQRSDYERERAGHALRESAGSGRRPEKDGSRSDTEDSIMDHVKWVPTRQECAPPK